MTEKKPEGTSSSNDPSSHGIKTSDDKNDDHNKYSFSSYHMNIISGNKQVQGIPSAPQQMHQPQLNDYQNFYGQPQMYQQPSQFQSPDIQIMLNNMFVVLNNQSKLLSYLINKNDHNFHTTNKIYDEVKNIKREETEEVQVNPGENLIRQTNYNSDITSKDLVNILYGVKTSFKYSIIVDSKVPFDTPLYRQRNFKLKINLIDQNGKLFANSNKIPISLALYTVENPPKFLESNTLGNKMLKGYTEQDLVNGVCLFQKIQIKEVTSHYRKNMLFLVAFAKVPSLGSIQDKQYVQYTQIRPLVIDRVVVKAKKMKCDSKHKDTVNEGSFKQQSQKPIDGDDNE